MTLSYAAMYRLGMQNIVEFDSVSYHWQGGKGVTDISFQARAGQVVLITGPSGAGKSTLLRLAVRLEQPNSGEVRYMGKALAEYNPSELRRNIGFVQQAPVLVKGSVRENLLLPFSFAAGGGSVKPTDAVLEEWLERLALQGVALGDDALSCSVGQRQRLCLIRTLLLEPACLCMDEPTSALDTESRMIVETMINSLAERGMSLLLVSHSDFRPSVPYTHVLVDNGQAVIVQEDCSEEIASCRPFALRSKP